MKLTLIAAVLSASLLAGPLQANTISGHEDSCETLAGVSMWVVDLKNRGMDWKAVKAQIREAADAAKGKENALISDQDDDALVMGVLEAVYHSPATNPRTVGRGVYRACMSAGKQTSL